MTIFLACLAIAAFLAAPTSALILGLTYGKDDLAPTAFWTCVFVGIAAVVSCVAIR